MFIKVYDIVAKVFIQTSLLNNNFSNTGEQIINCIPNVDAFDLEDCIKTITSENKGIGINNFIFDSNSRFLYITANKVLNTNKWLDKASQKPSTILSECDKVFSTEDDLLDDVISLKDALYYFYSLGQCSLANGYNFYLTLMDKAKQKYPDIKIKINDIDYEYKDIFLTITVNNESFDFNISQFEDEIDIENYNDNYDKADEIINSIMEVGFDSFLIFFSNCDKFKVFQDNEEILLSPINCDLKVLLSSWLTITNNYLDENNRYYLMSFNLSKENDIKYCQNEDISSIIIPNTEDILSKIFIQIKDFPIGYQDDLSKIRKDKLDSLRR